jgi:hypothetical protein
MNIRKFECLCRSSETCLSYRHGSLFFFVLILLLLNYSNPSSVDLGSIVLIEQVVATSRSCIFLNGIMYIGNQVRIRQSLRGGGIDLPGGLKYLRPILTQQPVSGSPHQPQDAFDAHTEDRSTEIGKEDDDDDDDEDEDQDQDAYDEPEDEDEDEGEGEQRDAHGVDNKRESLGGAQPYDDSSQDSGPTPGSGASFKLDRALGYDICRQARSPSMIERRIMTPNRGS